MFQNLQQIAEGLILNHVLHKLNTLRTVHHRFSVFQRTLQLLDRLASKLVFFVKILVFLLEISYINRRSHGALVCFLADRLPVSFIIAFINCIGSYRSLSANMLHTAKTNIAQRIDHFVEREVVFMCFLEIIMDKLNWFLHFKSEELVLISIRNVFFDLLKTCIPFSVTDF